jgi:class 3 adenylate cyclase
MAAADGGTSGISYLQSGDRYIAYRVQGSGPVDLLLCDEVTMISIDSADEPHRQHFDQRLASFVRLITFDRAGIGLSDPPSAGTPLGVDCWATDALAVLDAVGSERAAVLGSCGGGIALSLWARAPERVSHLILFNAYAHLRHAEADPWFQDYGGWVDATTRSEPDAEVLDDVAYLLPSLSDDPGFRRWWQQAGQRGASPKTAAAQNRALLDVDLLHVLPTIDVPTLVMCRVDAGLAVHPRSVALARDTPGAALIELPGADYFPFAGDADAVADGIEEFLTGQHAPRTVQRMLTTIFFSDIVNSTAQATRLGDREWRTRLDLHDAAMRRQFERFGGREVNTTGDGFLVCFDLPAQAIRCGLAACATTSQLGVEIRVGIHAGEVERRGDDVGGIAVHIGARVLAAADPATVFVSSTIRELVTGSGLKFSDRGPHDLKGVPGSWNLWEVVV